MKAKQMRLSALLDAGTRRQLWDLRDRLEVMETAALRRRHDEARPVRFNRHGIRILEVTNHAYAR